MNQLLKILVAMFVISVVVASDGDSPGTSQSDTSDPDAMTNVTNTIYAALQSITHPVHEAVINAIFSNCLKLKKIIKPESGQSPPDLSQLAVVFISPEITIRYNLTDAAELLPTSPLFKCQNKTIIFVHGFTESPYTDSYLNVTDAFLKKGEYNVVALDSSAYVGSDTMYVRAAENVRYIGQRFGDMLAKMLEVGTKPSEIYLVGHSLGAHIAGFAAKRFTALTKQRVGRITGLDPAGPCFVDVPARMRLRKTDADFVDIIHTDAGVFGINIQIGDVDFYPNGGSRQPGCMTDMCNHRRAWMMYCDTVLYPDATPAVACSSWSQFKRGKCNYTNVRLMGFECPSSARGRYYLQTNSNELYGRGKAGLHYDDTSLQRDKPIA